MTSVPMWLPDHEVLHKRGFSPSAIRIVQQLLPRARDRGLHELDVGTISALAFWTVIRWERKVGVAALESIGVNLSALADALNKNLEKRYRPVASQGGILIYKETGQRVFVANQEKKLEPFLHQAEYEAQEMQSDWVATEHLLLAALRVGDRDLLNLLKSHEIHYEMLKKAVLEIVRCA